MTEPLRNRPSSTPSPFAVVEFNADAAQSPRFRPCLRCSNVEAAQPPVHHRFVPASLLQRLAAFTDKARGLNI
ncbi:hypothetical protein PIB30_069141 [Stylosanthes scabra]|uniref:Uncharacterized protein n=1 Tax=Stylosanthes scabra TaxID=79078 RepID=A0ABU6UP51_9FABA|nr:hypothetical protein [Stylosanthes scabra]